jgi:8-oxo-dGTP diphosphatase
MKYNKARRKLSMEVLCVLLVFQDDEVKVIFTKQENSSGEAGWELPKSLLCKEETPEDAAKRISKQFTGYKLSSAFNMLDIQLKKNKDLLSVYYFAFARCTKPTVITRDGSPDTELFALKHISKNVSSDTTVIKKGLSEIQQKATNSLILFSLLPLKFTILQLYRVYECVFDVSIDKRNFSRKILSTGLLQTKKEKDKTTSKKGSFLYTFSNENKNQIFSGSFR